MIAIKKELFKQCQRYLSKRIMASEEAIKESQASANDETKSSAGDKYETGRAMMQLEIEKNSTQLAESMKLKRTLDLINVDRVASKVQSGSLVITDNGNFFIAISVGMLKVDDKSYAAIASDSPIGLKLIGLEKGSSFSFNNKSYTIEQLW